MTTELLVIAVIVIVGLLIDLAILLFVRRVVKLRPTQIKLLRFEAGNIPVGTFRYTLLMQYFGYLFMLVALEPLFILILVLSVSAIHTIPLTLFVTVCLLTLAVPIYLAYKLSVELAYMFEKKSLRVRA